MTDITLSDAAVGGDTIITISSVRVDRAAAVGAYETPVDLPVRVDAVRASLTGSGSGTTRVDAVRASGVYMDHAYVPPIDYTDNAIVDRVDGAGYGRSAADTRVDAVRASGVYMDHAYVPPIPDIISLLVDRVALAAAYEPTQPAARVNAIRAVSTSSTDPVARVNRVAGIAPVSSTAATRINRVLVVGVYKSGVDPEDVALLFSGAERYYWLKR